MLKRIFKIYSTYQEAKARTAEQTASVVERSDRPWLAFIFIGLSVWIWFGALTSRTGPVEIYEATGFTGIVAVLVVSYFSFYLGSKIIFRLTDEERFDDTSILAIFSACERRERRSLISMVLAFVHSLIFVGYVLSKDQKLVDALFFTKNSP